MDETLLFPSTAKKARVEIIPLIDVVFFLLATFVLFTLSLEKISTLNLTLPQNGEPSPEDNTVHLHAAEHGAFTWKQGRFGETETLAIGEIRGRLEAYKRGVASPRVLISSDPGTKFGATVRLLDEVREARIEQVSVETLASGSGAGSS